MGAGELNGSMAGDLDEPPRYCVQVSPSYIMDAGEQECKVRR